MSCGNGCSDCACEPGKATKMLMISWAILRYKQTIALKPLEEKESAFMEAIEEQLTDEGYDEEQILKVAEEDDGYKSETARLFAVSQRILDEGGE